MRRLAFVALACVAAVAAAAAAAHGSRTESPNVAVFPQTAHPYGADMATWGERATQWVYAQPLDRPFPNVPKPPARFLLSLTGVFSPER